MSLEDFKTSEYHNNESKDIVTESGVSVSEDEYFWNWVAGFFDGEGAFCISVQRSQSYNLNYTIRIGIEVTQHASDENVDTMSSIVEKSGIGKLYNRTKDGRDNQVRWYTYDTHEVITLIEKMGPHLRIKDDESEEVMKLAKQKQNKEHTTKDGLLNMVKRRDKIRQQYRTDTRSSREMAHNYKSIREELEE